MSKHCEQTAARYRDLKTYELIGARATRQLARPYRWIRLHARKRPGRSLVLIGGGCLRAGGLCFEVTAPVSDQIPLRTAVRMIIHKLLDAGRGGSS